MFQADSIAAFIIHVVSRSQAARPLVFGLNGPQGCGKTTATSSAVELLRDKHQLRGITVSIDDFYLTRAEQVQLATEHAANAYLQQRGYPGTHDIRLGSDTLSKLRAINQDHRPLPIPRYDKSAYAGEGDRLPRSDWPTVAPTLDYVILEGWCVGFSPLPESAIANRNLLEVNRYLARYTEWYAFLTRLFNSKHRIFAIPYAGASKPSRTCARGESRA